jgi:MYXO-CTERM domain-containing protein
MRYTLLAGASVLALGFVSPASAGNIVLTGHDNELHCSGGGAGGGAGSPCTVLGAETDWARAGSLLPVLAIDQGGELPAALTFEGIASTVVKPGDVTAGMFDHSKYSAFVVASVSTCGGCDNPVGTGTLLATFETAIAAFFNAGGGIVGLTSASDPNGFAYAPEVAGSTSPIFDSSGFVATPAGLAGIPGFSAVNGDQTHNIFPSFNSFYKVAEVFNPDGGITGSAVTIFGSGGITCTGTHCHVTPSAPEASTWTMMVLGFAGFGLVAARARRRRRLAMAA